MKDATQTVVGLASAGLGIIALFNSELRAGATIALFITLGVAGVYLKVNQFSIVFKKLETEINNVKETLDTFKKRQDIYKKLYKLESAVRLLKMKKGSFDPGWIFAGVVVLVLIYFILKATNVI